jgi:hypothetical protein
MATLCAVDAGACHEAPVIFRRGMGMGRGSLGNLLQGIVVQSEVPGARAASWCLARVQVYRHRRAQCGNSRYAACALKRNLDVSREAQRVTTFCRYSFRGSMGDDGIGQLLFDFAHTHPGPIHLGFLVSTIAVWVRGRILIALSFGRKVAIR